MNILLFGRRINVETVPFLFGVNVSGAEFGGSEIPGIYATDYIYPSTANIDYYYEKGARIFRLPFLWERLQQTLNGDLDADELARLTATVSYITGLGARCIIDPHNYSKYKISGIEYQIGTDEVPTSAFLDFWSKLATHFKSNSKAIFCICNEPTNASATDWAAIAQSAINTIRSVGAKNRLHVPGTSYTGAHSWFSSGNAAALVSITDSENNFAFDIHQYLDSDNSGTHATVSNPYAGIYRIAPVVEWARTRGFKLYLGEINAGDNTMAITATEVKALLSTVDYVIENRDVLEGISLWGAGAWWGDSYIFNLNKLGEDERVRTVALFARDITFTLHDSAVIDIDFCKGALKGVASLADGLSLTQAGSLFSVNNAGVWSAFSPNTLRVTDRGLWTEVTKTNYFASHIFTPSSASNLTYETGFLAPDGSANATRVVDLADAGAVTHTLTFQKSIEFSSFATSDAVCFSAFTKLNSVGVSGSIIYFWMKASKPDTAKTLNISTSQASATPSYFESNGWRRPSLNITYSSPVENLNFGFQPDSTPNQGHVPDAYTGVGATSIDVWFKQAEKGLFPSSPIILGEKNSSATRETDVLQAIGPLLVALQEDEVTIVFQVSWMPQVAVVLPLLSINNDTVCLRRNANYSVGGDLGSTQSTAVASGGSIAFRHSIKIGLSVNRTTGRVCVGAEGIASVGADVIVPEVSSVQIGPAEGFIESMQVYAAFSDTTDLDVLMNGQ